MIRIQQRENERECLTVVLPKTKRRSLAKPSASSKPERTSDYLLAFLFAAQNALSLADSFALAAGLILFFLAGAVDLTDAVAGLAP